MISCTVVTQRFHLPLLHRSPDKLFNLPDPGNTDSADFLNAVKTRNMPPSQTCLEPWMKQHDGTCTRAAVRHESASSSHKSKSLQNSLPFIPSDPLPWLILQWCNFKSTVTLSEGGTGSLRESWNSVANSHDFYLESYDFLSILQLWLPEACNDMRNTASSSLNFY